MSNQSLITIQAEPIELCQLLKFAGLASSGGEAKQVINDGLVTVNGAIETQKRKKIVSGDVVIYADHTLTVQVA